MHIVILACAIFALIVIREYLLTYDIDAASRIERLVIIVFTIICIVVGIICVFITTFDFLAYVVKLI